MAGRAGIAIVNVLIFAVFTTVFLVAGVSFTQGAMKAGRKAGSTSQVYNVALAGVTHSVFWLQRQAVQPVLAFDPRANGVALAPDEDTETKVDEEQLGLVQEFEIDAAKGLWGRYEVGRSKNAPARSGLSAGASSALYPDGVKWTAEDVSAQRGQLASPGSVWRVRSRGYVFLRKAPTDGFVAAPPKGSPITIIEKMTLEAEIRSSVLKYRAACIYGFGTGLSGQDNAFDEGDDNTKPLLEVLDGSARGYWFRSNELQNSTDIALNPGGLTVTRNDSTISTSLGDQIDYVFGVSTSDEVKAMADAAYTTSSTLPSPLGTDQLIHLTGNFTFDGSPDLKGSGILFVNGDCILDGSSNDQEWEGLIFATGKFTLSENASVRGAVIAGRNTFLDAASGKQPKIQYSEDVLNALGSLIGSYRMERSTLRAIDDATATSF